MKPPVPGGALSQGPCLRGSLSQGFLSRGLLTPGAPCLGAPCHTGCRWPQSRGLPLWPRTSATKPTTHRRLQTRLA